MNRFLLVILGTAMGIDQDLNHIADSESGVNFVDGKGMFICTFYSPYSTSEIHEKLVHRPAMMVFDITNSESYGVNLPSKYYTGIFPEVKKELDSMMDIQKQMINDPNTVYDETNGNTFTRVNRRKPEPTVEEYDSVNDILDKLSLNNYDRKCLTEKEIEILNKG